MKAQAYSPKFFNPTKQTFKTIKPTNQRRKARKTDLKELARLINAKRII